MVFDKAAQGAFCCAQCTVQHVDVDFPRLILGLDSTTNFKATALYKEVSWSQG